MAEQAALLGAIRGTIFANPVGSCLPHGNEHADDLHQQTLAGIDVGIRQESLRDKNIQACGTFKRRPVGVSQGTIRSLVPRSCSLSNIDENAFRTAIQMVTRGNPPGHANQQLATHCRESHAFLYTVISLVQKSVPF
jgi:hypothetical protein